MELIQLSPYTIAALGHTIEFAKASRRPSNKELQRNAVFPLPKGAIEVKRNYWPQNCQHLTVWTLFCFFCLFVFVVETLECICKSPILRCMELVVNNIFLWLWPKIPSANGHRPTVPLTNWKQTNKTQKMPTSTCLFVCLLGGACWAPLNQVGPPSNCQDRTLEMSVYRLCQYLFFSLQNKKIYSVFCSTMHWIKPRQHPWFLRETKWALYRLKEYWALQPGGSWWRQFCSYVRKPKN